MALQKQRFSTQIDPQLLARAKAIAAADHRQLQNVIEEALIDLIQKRAGVRPEVMATYRETVAQYSAVCEHLAK